MPYEEKASLPKGHVLVAQTLGEEPVGSASEAFAMIRMNYRAQLSRGKSVNALYACLSGRVRGVCEGLLELEQRQYLFHHKVRVAIFRADWMFDHRVRSLTFAKRGQRRLKKPPCTLFAEAILEQDEPHTAGNQAGDLSDFFVRRQEEMCHDEKDRGLPSPEH